jgi:hypothetical protein
MICSRLFVYLCQYIAFLPDDLSNKTKISLFSGKINQTHEPVKVAMISGFHHSWNSIYLRSEIVLVDDDITTTIEFHVYSCYVVDQVPVEIAKAMGADIVIGVSLGFAQFFEKPKHPHQSP